MLPKRGRARTGCAVCRRHKTFLLVCVQKELALTPYLTYNLTYSMTPSDPHPRIAVLERELAWAHLKIQSLTEALRQQRVKLLGPRSETLSDLQLQLLVEEEPGTSREEVEAEAQRPAIANVPPRQRRSHPGRQRLPENLPRVEEVIRCGEQTCNHCGAETSVIGYDESEVLDREPAR